MSERLQRLLRRLRAVDGRAGQTNVEPVPTVPDGPQRSTVRFVGYAKDCRIDGWIELRGERLSDALNASRDIRLTNVQLIGMDDGIERPFDELVIRQNELVAVWAEDAATDPDRRVETRSTPILVRTGPYLLQGEMHSVVASQRLNELRNRRAFVPLTDAAVETTSGDFRETGRGPLIVNRLVAEDIAPAPHADLSRVLLPTTGRQRFVPKDMTAEPVAI
jgi:hypothetical protein